MNYSEYIEYIEVMEGNRFDATPHLDEDGTALAPQEDVEPGCLFDSYTEEAA